MIQEREEQESKREREKRLVEVKEREEESKVEGWTRRLRRGQKANREEGKVTSHSQVLKIFL